MFSDHKSSHNSLLNYSNMYGTHKQLNNFLGRDFKHQDQYHEKEINIQNDFLFLVDVHHMYTICTPYARILIKISHCKH